MCLKRRLCMALLHSVVKGGIKSPLSKGEKLVKIDHIATRSSGSFGGREFLRGTRDRPDVRIFAICHIALNLCTVSYTISGAIGCFLSREPPPECKLGAADHGGDGG